MAKVMNVLLLHEMRKEPLGHAKKVILSEGLCSS